MIWRLVFDAVRRSRQIYLFMFPLITLFWVIAAIDSGTNWAVTGSLAMAYAFGPMAIVANMSLRELRTLPVTTRDLWVATWLGSTTVTTLAIAAAQGVSILGVKWVSGTTAVSAEAVLLTAIYCFAYAGATVPIMPALGYSLGRIETHRPRWLWVALSMGVGGLFVGAFVAPYFFADFLPLTMRQIWWGPILAVASCLTIAGVSLAWTPQRGGIVRGTAVRQGTARPSSPDRQRFTDRLTGIPRLAWPFAISFLSAAAVTLAGFIGYWAAFDSGNSLKSFLQHNAVLLFDTGFRPNPGMGDMWIPLALAFIGMSSPWKPFARQLKVLPLTVHQVNALLLATPFTLWALAWVVLIAAHILVIGRIPDTLRLDVFVFVGGVSALGQVLMMRSGHRGGLWIIMLMGVMMSMARRLSNGALSIPVEVLLISVGVVALAAAAFVNHRTLTRSTSSARIFQQDSLPFGMGSPGAQR